MLSVMVVTVMWDRFLVFFLHATFSHSRKLTAARGFLLPNRFAHFPSAPAPPAVLVLSITHFPISWHTDDTRGGVCPSCGSALRVCFFQNILVNRFLFLEPCAWNPPQSTHLQLWNLYFHFRWGSSPAGLWLVIE